MNRTQIEWVKNPDGSQGYTWNPITGCLNHTDGLCKGGGFPCYAYKLAHGRLKQRYLANRAIAPFNFNSYEALNILDRNNRANPFYPRFWEERLYDPIWLPSSYRGPSPKGIFLCDMSDLFGIGIPNEWTDRVMNVIKACRYHRFYLLTKQPQNLIKWSPFPENCWVGVTCTNQTMVLEATNHLYNHRIAKTQFLSVEPLLSWDTSHFSRPLTDSISKLDIDWLIIGACTGSWEEMNRLEINSHLELTIAKWGNKWTVQPKIEWVQEIVQAADKAGIRVFEKNNLVPLLGNTLRQELPE